MSVEQAEPLDLARVRIDPAVALRIPAPLALRRQALPFARLEGRVHVACANPADATLARALQRYYAEPLLLHAVPAPPLRKALERTFGDAAAGARGLRAGEPARPGAAGGAAGAAAGEVGEGAVALGDELLQAAVLRGASDIHLDPERDGVRVRMRVDGALEEYRRLPTDALAGLLSRFKVLSDMDIAEKRAPQDGSFTHTYAVGAVGAAGAAGAAGSGPRGAGVKAVEVRTATLPTQYGERMTLRLLALQTGELTLERLGMSPEHLEAFDRQLQRPHGLILVTGATGCGKSTTLYAAIRRLIGLRALNVITVEDPVEYDIAGVAQVEVDSADKVSFGKALRSILRHDPDVVMIGEVRDRDSADVAIKAALTGHLVLSTLHTNSAPSAITRLHDVGVERYLVAATLRLAMAQRLVRRLCAACRRARPLSGAEAAALGDPEAAGQTAYEEAGCLYCAGRGYDGRVGLFEVLTLDAAWSERVAAGEGEAELLAAMRREGVATLADGARRRVLDGTTSVAQAIAAVTVW